MEVRGSTTNEVHATTFDSGPVNPSGSGDGATLDSAVPGIANHCPMVRLMTQAGGFAGGGAGGGGVGVGVGVGVGDGDGDGVGVGDGDGVGDGEGDEGGGGEAFAPDSPPPPPHAPIANARSKASERCLSAVVKAIIWLRTVRAARWHVKEIVIDCEGRVDAIVANFVTKKSSLSNDITYCAVAH